MIQHKVLIIADWRRNLGNDFLCIRLWLLPEINTTAELIDCYKFRLFFCNINDA